VGKLTATGLTKLLKTPGRYQDGDGLMLNVTSPGKASWLLRLQVANRRREFGLGSVLKVGLADARSRADEIRRQYAAGLDPVLERKKAQQVIPTFRAAAEQFHAEHKASWKNGKHQDQWLKTLELYVFPEFGSVTVDKIDGPMVRDALLPIWLSIPETSRRVRQRIGAVLDWSFSKGFRSTELTMRGLSRGLPKQPRRDGHHAAMPFVDVPAFVTKVKERESMGRLALLAVIFTACRSGEVRGARWAEVDLDSSIWTIPADRMKAGREHRVPLSAPAIDVFEAAAELRIAGSDLVFYGSNPRKPLSDMTLLKVLRDADLKFTAHGFRSSFRDWAAERTDFPDAVAEAALAHAVSDAVVAAYKRTKFDEKRRELMDAWGKFLTADTSNVVPLDRARRKEGVAG
jgi:integrase